MKALGLWTPSLPTPQPHLPSLLFASGLGNWFSFHLGWHLSGQPKKKTLIYDQTGVGGGGDAGQQGWVGTKRQYQKE